MDQVRFSIIMPTYNRASLIERSIQSVLDQSFRDFELIIVDDGSVDNTASVVNDISDERLKYIKIENGERGRARNIGRSAAVGQYVYFLDSDDLLYPFHLKEADSLLVKDFPIIWLPYEICDSSGSVIRRVRKSKKSVLDRLLREGNFLSCHGVFIRRDLADLHPFSENRELSGSEDMELWIRMACRYPFEIGPRVTSCLVEHDQRSVNNFDNIDKLVERKRTMINSLMQDRDAWSEIHDKRHLIESSSMSYIALHGLLNSNVPIKHSIEYFLRSLTFAPSTFFTRRTAAILKHIVMRSIKQ